MFGWGSQISLPSRYGPGLKTARFFKIYLLPELLSYRDVTYVFGNLRTWAKK